MSKHYIYLITVLFIFFSTNIHAQKRIFAQVPISVSIKQGVSFNKLRGDLNFPIPADNILKSNLTKHPADGLQFEITGASRRSIIIECGSGQLNKTDPNDDFYFEPSIQLTDCAGEKIEQTTTPILNFKNSIYSEKLVLSVGGKLKLPEVKNTKNIQGNFILTLTY